MKRISIMNPYLLGRDFDVPASVAKRFSLVDAKGGGKGGGGGGGGSSKEYERQLAEQRQAREKAEAEAAQLKQNQEATAADRKRRGQASFLTGGDGEGDSSDPTKKSYLGSGS